MSSFEQTPSQAGPGTEAWEAFWDEADANRTYPSDGFSPRAVAAGVVAMRAVLGQERYVTDYFNL